MEELDDKTYKGQNIGSSISSKLGKASRYGLHLDSGLSRSYIIARMSGSHPLADIKRSSSISNKNRKSFIQTSLRFECFYMDFLIVLRNNITDT